MIYDIILGVILLWAAVFAGNKVIRFIRQASDDKTEISCTCSGCPSRSCCGGGCSTEHK